MKFLVVTPCQAVDSALIRTLKSIRQQSIATDSQHSISYHVQCNNMTPGLFDELKSDFPDTSVVSIKFYQSPDSGIYDAIAKIFAVHNEEDIYCYLGSGDELSPHAFEILDQAYAEDTQWLTGIICGINTKGHMIESQIPYCYRSTLIRTGFYGRVLPYIQQESTFWGKDLHAKLDWQATRAFKYAGDAYLWYQLAHHANLTVVEAWLGAFEQRPGQTSETHATQYATEMQSFSDKPSIVNWLRATIDWGIWKLPRTLKRLLGKHRIVYDQKLEQYRRHS